MTKNILLKILFLFMLSIGGVLLVITLASFTVPTNQLNNQITNSTISQFLPPASFEDVTQKQSLFHTHIQHTGEISDLIDVMSAGACAEDFNNDGWIDLLFASGGGQTRFYGRKSWWQSHKNVQVYANNKGSFSHIDSPGLDVLGSTTSCATADFDQDGLADLIITTIAEDYLFKNLGDFKFRKIPLFSQIADPVWTTHVAVADIDNDGDPDIHLSHFLRYQKNQKSLENSAGFSEQHQRQFKPEAFDGLTNQILLNTGGFTFVNATKEMNLGELSERTVSATWRDLDNDNRQDLIELNLSDQPIRAFLNKADGLVPVIDENLLLQANNSHSFSYGQELLDPSPISIVTRPAGLASLVSLHLYNMKSSDISWQSNIVNHSQVYLNYWGAFFADFNNDGFTDLTLASGGYGIDPFAHKMTLPSPNICASQKAADPLSNAPQFSLFNCIQGSPASTRGAVRIDFNNDGKLDILYANNNDFPQLLANTTANTGNWISFSIPPSLRFKFSKLTLATKKHMIEREVATQSTLFGQHDPRLHFGLSDKTDVEVTLYDNSANIVFEQSLAVNSIYQLDDKRWRIPSSIAEASNTSPKQDKYFPSQIRFSLGSTLDEELWESAYWSQQNTDPMVSQEITNILHQATNHQHLALYQALLSSDDISLIESAADSIKKLELESSVGNLLYLLDTADQPLYCIITEIFAHWFEQEEAVVRAKYKAVPSLIRRLKQHNADIVACSAKALGYSEHTNAASAILQSFDNAPIASQAQLVSALGNIRQGEALPLLKSLLTKSRNVEVLQQSIIALTRLNDSSLNQQIKQIINNKQKGSALFLAIASMESAKDAVVVSIENRQMWLANRSNKTIDFADLENNSLRMAYLEVALKFKLPIPLLATVNQLNDDQLSMLVAKQKLRSNQFKLSEIEAALSLSLDTELASLLSVFLNNSVMIQDMSQLAPRQIASLINIFGALQNTDKLKLFTLAKKTESEVEMFVKPELVFQQCKLNHIQNRELMAIIELVPPSLKSMMQICSISSDINNLSLVAIAQTINSADDNNSSVHNTNNLLYTLSSLLEQKQMTKLSAALLFHSSLTKAQKNEWALQYFLNDQYKQNWLQINIPTDEKLVLALLTNIEGYQLIVQTLEKTKIKASTIYTENTIKRLSSYAHLVDFIAAN